MDFAMDMKNHTFVSHTWTGRPNGQVFVLFPFFVIEAVSTPSVAVSWGNHLSVFMI
jgi:hypothetical protein